MSGNIEKGSTGIKELENAKINYHNAGTQFKSAILVLILHNLKLPHCIE